MNRSLLKATAKTTFTNHYGMALLASFLPVVIAGAAGNLFIVGIVLVYPLYVGQALMFMSFSRNENVELDTLFSGYRGNQFGKFLVAMLLRDVFIFLWTLLFIVPGIIKSLSYALVPYLLADSDVSSDEDVITRSRVMMDGYKWDLFMLYLSFIGWFLLSLLTFGILGIFYVGPYLNQSIALFYQEVKSANIQRLE